MIEKTENIKIGMKKTVSKNQKKEKISSKEIVCLDHLKKTKTGFVLISNGKNAISG